MRKSVLLGLGALVAVSALFLACGGSDDKSGDNNDTGGQTQNIRIGKGLSVANLGSGNGSLNGDDASAEQSSASGVGGAAPAADGSSRSAATGYSGGVGGDSISAQQASPTANTGITVQGYGSATADADSAIVEFGFSNNGYNGQPIPYLEGDVKPFPSTPGTAAPITRETLQPVIDALVGAGVSADDIELLNQGYYDPYYSSATLRATINDVDAVDGAVEAAQAAAADVDSVYLNSTNVNYTLQNCETLERAAVQAAVEDAGDRAAVLADVLDVTLGDVAGASDYSWYNYGTGCGSDSYGPYPIAYTPWRIGGSGDGTVQVVSNISVTYAFS